MTKNNAELRKYGLPTSSSVTGRHRNQAFKWPHQCGSYQMNPNNLELANVNDFLIIRRPSVIDICLTDGNVVPTLRSCLWKIGNK